MSEQSYPGTLDSLEPIREYVAEAATAAGLGSKAIYSLCLAVDEIATNIVTHGYDEAGLTGDIKVSAHPVGERFEVLVTDYGQAYDPEKHQQPADTEANVPLEERRMGGLGILLAKNAVDELHYSSGADGNVHRFVLKLSPDSK